MGWTVRVVATEWSYNTRTLSQGHRESTWGIPRGRKKCLELGVSRRSREVVREKMESWGVDAVSSVDSPAHNGGHGPDWYAQEWLLLQR